MTLRGEVRWKTLWERCAEVSTSQTRKATGQRAAYNPRFGLWLLGLLDGLDASWASQRVYCNPLYGRGVGRWLAKAREAELAVYLLPSRTDTAWWHEYAMRADEIRFVRGRLKFGGAAASAPFPSVVLVYRASHD